MDPTALKRRRGGLSRAVMALLTMTLGLVGVGAFAGVAHAAVPTNNNFPIIDRDVSVCADDFGAPRTGHTHQGNDCFAPAGTPLLAVESGTVTTGVDSLGGNYVLLLGNSGTGYYYAHNSQNLVSTGDRVAKGQHIAKVGNTGNAAGGPTHCHFEIRPGGIHQPAINPHPYLNVWTTVHSTPSPPPKTHLLWLQRNSLSGGIAENDFVFGLVGDLPLVGDWDGNGTDTPGVYRPSEANFYLKNSNTGGEATIVVHYGTAGTGQWPVVGDWDGNGTDTIGVFNLNTGQWLLRNSNTAGTANINTVYGTQGDLPIVGDWDGNHTTTFGVRRGNTWLLRNSNTAGTANIALTYGQSNDFPLVGDWNGNTTDGIGVIQGNTWLLRYSLSPGNPQITFTYGRTADIFTPGDWNGNGTPDTGIVRAV